MKLFQMMEVKEAVAWSGNGGQALHVHTLAKHFPDAPQCFKRSPEAAHLFDLDLGRLVATAKRLGVRQIVVHHEGTPRQHVDLCGRPLLTAKQLCVE